METTLFKGGSGRTSSRRVLAFILSFAGIISGGFAIFYKLDWKSIAVAFGIPLFFATMLLLFTTWADVARVISFKKGNNEQ